MYKPFKTSLVLFFILGLTEIAQNILKKSTFRLVNQKIVLNFPFKLEVVRNCLSMHDMAYQTRDREDLIIA